MISKIDSIFIENGNFNQLFIKLIQYTLFKFKFQFKFKLKLNTILLYLHSLFKFPSSNNLLLFAVRLIYIEFFYVLLHP